MQVAFGSWATLEDMSATEQQGLEDFETDRSAKRDTKECGKRLPCVRGKCHCYKAWLLSAHRREVGALRSLSANVSVRDAPRAVCARKKNATPFGIGSFPDNHGGVSIVALCDDL